MIGHISIWAWLCASETVPIEPYRTRTEPSPCCSRVWVQHLSIGQQLVRKGTFPPQCYRCNGLRILGDWLCGCLDTVVSVSRWIWKGSWRALLWKGQLYFHSSPSVYEGQEGQRVLLQALYWMQLSFLWETEAVLVSPCIDYPRHRTDARELLGELGCLFWWHEF